MKIFCSGIGGIGLSAYAALQHYNGHEVLGSDRTMTELLKDLESQGIGITTDQTGTAIPKDADLFVYSEAIPEDAPERKKAMELGITQKSYPEALGELSAKHKVIAVCGTHGKSSTTAMAARLLIEAGLDPTVVVGTKLKELDGRNWRKGKSDIFILEACEYRRSFHHYSPSVILLTNADGDHFDYFASLEEYQKAFIDFVKKLPSDGVLITHMQDPQCRAIAEVSGAVPTDADTFPLLTLKTPGVHMQHNAQLVQALANIMQIPSDQAEKAITGYAGSWRRMEFKGMTHEVVPVIDDYAHHPTEIRATIAAIRGQYPDSRLVCVFQPHTHNRTLSLYDDFVGAFSDADVLIVTDVYEARNDTEKDKVNLPAFLKDITEKSGVEARQGGTLARTEAQLHTLLQPGDILLCLGAGDSTVLASKMVDAATA